MKKYLSLVFLMWIVGYTHVSIFSYTDKRLVLGTIQFPQSIQMIPTDLRVYHSGNIVKIDSDNTSRRLTFSLLVDHHQTHFFLLIVNVEQFQKVMDYDNTVKYLKINPQQPYKLYLLQQVSEHSNIWDIKKQALPNGRIPDTAIIVCYPPEYVDGLYGGTNIELPRIKIRDDILNIVGSEASLHARSHQIVLTCLDYDAIHSPLTPYVKKANQLTTIVALDA